MSFVLNQEEDEAEEGADQSRGDATIYVTVLRYAGFSGRRRRRRLTQNLENYCSAKTRVVETL